MTTVAVRKDDAELRKALYRVRDEGERIILEEDGALVSIEDLKALEEMEDRLDEQAAHEALAESDERIPYEQVRKELGL